jgi:hypothetical protein
MAKAASIVFADTETREALGRVVNALTTAKEFKEASRDPYQRRVGRARR